MGVFGNLALTGTPVPLQTAGYTRLVLQAEAAYRFSNNKADCESDGRNTFTQIAKGQFAFTEVIIVGNLGETIWFDATGASVNYTLS